MGKNIGNERNGLKIFHKMIIVHIIYFIVKMINAVTARLGIPQKHAPAEIVMGQKFDAKKYLCVRFEAYVEASRDSIITNDMTDKTHR